jgi:N6-adenosine-specific RNA methylase IME4
VKIKPIAVTDLKLSEINTRGLDKPDPTHVAQLVSSIRDCGLLNPITVDQNFKLIAGRHRLEAVRELKWPKIRANIVSLDSLHAELARIDENLVRRPGTALERAEWMKDRKEIYEQLHPETKQGGAPGKKGGGKGAKTETISSFAKDTAAKTGSTDRSVQQYVQVAGLDDEAKLVLRSTPAADHLTDLVKLSRLAPELQRKVAKQVASTGETVKAATRTLKRAEQVAQVKVYRPPEGEFAVIATDYPWKYEDALDGSDAVRGGCPYPQMEIEEICKVPLPVAKDCAVFVWVTNSHLVDPKAYAVVAQSLFDRYQLVPKQIRTWRKVTIDGTRDKFGGGHVWRNNTEHLVRFERGRPVFAPVTQTTCFDAPLGEHSEKPKRAYDDIEALCPGGPKLEMFARDEVREGWVTTGAELKAPIPAPRSHHEVKEPEVEDNICGGANCSGCADHPAESGFHAGPKIEPPKKRARKLLLNPEAA